MEIRRARPEDGPAFIALVHALAGFEELPPPDEDAEKRLLADAFSDPPRYHLWVADDDGSIIAYAVTFTTYSTFRALPSLYLEDLFVHPNHRRRGVASAVLARLRTEAEATGCGRFEWMVLDWNTGAHALYDDVGAERTTQWHLCRVSLPDPS